MLKHKYHYNYNIVYIKKNNFDKKKVYIIH